MTTITLTLSVEETNQLLSLLGDQPIKTGLADLTAKIKGQGDTQLAHLAANVENVTDVTDVAHDVA
jgi:hypothetical protein